MAEVDLAERLDAAHVSTGAMLRDAVSRGTKLGRSVQGFMDSGELVPDRLLFEVLAERLAREDVRVDGFVLDGFPRAVEQAEHLALLLASQTIDVAINLAVDPRVVLARLLRRRVCAACGQTVSHSASAPVASRCPGCGGSLGRRDDDNRSAIVRRLALYEQHTRPLLAWYAAQGLLVTVDGHGSPDAVASGLDDPDRSQARHAPGETRAFASHHDLIDILVGKRCFLGQRPWGAGTHRDPGCFELG
jgi:adenylate kinase